MINVRILGVLFLVGLNSFGSIKEKEAKVRRLDGVLSSIFYQNDMINFIVAIDFSRKELKAGTNVLLEYNVFDFYSKKIASGKKGLKVSTATIEARIFPQIPKELLGWFTIKFKLIYERRKFDLAGTVDFAITANIKQTLNPDSYFGIGYGAFHIPKQPVLTFTDDMAIMLKRMGVDYLKVWVRPYRLFKNGKANWSKADRLVNVATRNGIIILGTLSALSSKKIEKELEEAEIKKYQKYLSKIITRYKGKISNWEIGNEPNSRHFKGGQAFYTKVLKASYQTIKAITPNATVITGGLTGVKPDWLRGVFKNYSKPYFDVIAIHPYRKQSTVPEKAYPDMNIGYGKLSLEEGIKHTFSLYDKFSWLKDYNRRIWSTEAGYSTYGLKFAKLHNPPVSEKMQASLLFRTMLLSYTFGVKKFFWWKIHSTSGGGMGVLSDIVSGSMPKPAYSSYLTLKGLLSEVESTKYSSIPKKNIYFVQLKKKGKKIIIAWTLNNEETIVFSKQKIGFMVKDIMGNEINNFTIEGSNVSVKLTEYPVSIEGVY